MRGAGLAQFTIRLANPSFDHLPRLQRQFATEADAPPRHLDALAAWRALRLNLAASDVAEAVLIEEDA